MAYTVAPSTGVRVRVWREQQLFHAAREGAVETPQICLGVDLFEVIAELSGLDLEQPNGAAEADKLARQAQERLASEAPAQEPRAFERDEGRGQATDPRA